MVYMEDSKTIKKPKKPNNFNGKAGPGRPPGLKNKIKLSSVHETLFNNNFDPVLELIKLIPTLTNNAKVEAIALLMKYAYSLPVQEVSKDISPIQITYKVQD